MTTTSSTRTFVALRPGARQREAIATAIRRLAQANPASRPGERGPVRWIEPERVHLTLAFLGELEPEAVASTVRISRAVADSSPAFDWAPSGFGAFPTRRRARVVWIGVEPGGDAIRELHASLARALRREGLLEDRGPPFTPHLTVGRVRGRGRPVHLPDVEPGPADRADEVTVFASDLRPEGAYHRPLATAPLRGAG